MKLITKLLTLLSVFTVLGTIHNSPHSAEANTAAEVTDAKRVYSIVVDRFLNIDESNDQGRTEDDDPQYPFGGDFKGIESELDYISEMGFDTLHLSPVFEHEPEDYLGYDVTNYNEIEESFGGEEDFQSLIDSAHDLDMEVIVDIPMVANEDYEPLDSNDILANDIYQSYLDDRSLDIIDFQNPDNQEQYRDMLQSFTDTFDVDGLTFMTAQDDIDATAFVPDDLSSYAITTTEDMTGNGFDYTAYEETRRALAASFSTVDTEVPELPESSTEFLLADHWFSERFTLHAVNEDMFPGTRITQLMTYLYAYRGPISMLYGTEVALNGETFPEIHRQMDLWTDQEVVEYIEEISHVFGQHKNAFTGELETIYNEDGHYVARYHTNDVDFILNVNDTSETTHVTLSGEDIDEGNVLSGMLIGDMVRPGDEGEYRLVLDREETEFYAIVEEMGLNNGYIIAGLIIFGGFAVFIFFAARNNKKKKKHNVSQ